MIKENEKLPQAIIDAYNRDKLVLFIGAGISRLMGCKGWSDLADELLSENFNYKESQMLKNAQLSDKEKITITFQKCKQNKNLDAFYNTMAKSFTCDNGNEDIYKYIIKFKCIFVTTNADDLLEKHNLDNRYSVNCSVNNLSKVESPYLFYLHGRFGNNTEEDRKTLVFCVDEYLKRYNNPEVIDFLDNLFSTHVVLFLGYGLNEFELLDHLFSKIKVSESIPLNHYILEGFCSDLDSLVEAKRSYYNSIGIELLTYCQDVDGYNRQYEIIKNWVEQLTEQTFYTSDILNRIKLSLEQFSNDNYEDIKHILCELDTQKIYLDYVLKTMPTSKDYYLYLRKIWNDKIITIDDCPGVIYYENGYESPYWNFADCINQTIKNNLQDKEFQEFTAEILNSLIYKINSDIEIIKNFNLRRTIIDTIFLLNDKIINQKYIDFICCTDYCDSITIDVVGYEIMRMKPDWLKWDKNIINQLFKFIFGFKTVNNKSISNVHNYNMIEIYNKIQHLLNEEQKEFLYTTCIGNIFKSFDNVNYAFYDSFETQLQGYDFSYQKHLFSIIKELIIYIGEKTKNETILRILEQSQEKMHFQFALSLCKLMECNISILNKFKVNPLSLDGTLVDFYDFLSNYKKGINNVSAKAIINYINNAVFGEKVTYQDYKKRITTYRLEIYNLLKNRNSLFMDEYNKLLTEEHFQIGNPVEKAWDRIPTVTYYHPKKIFTRDELDSLKVIDMISKVSAGNTLQQNMINRESYEEFIDYLIENKRFIDIFDTLANKNEIDSNSIFCIMAVLVQDKYKENYNNIKFLNMINLLLNKIYRLEESDNKTILIKNVLRILKYCHENKLFEEELLEICLNVDANKLWNGKIYKNSFDDHEIINNMINDGECMLYLLIFSIIIDMKNKNKKFETFLGKFKNYCNTKLKENNKWFLLSASYNFQNSFYLDKEWANEIFKVAFNDDVYISKMIAVACRTSDIIIKMLSDKILTKQVMKSILVTEKIDNEYITRIIDYIVSSYIFGLISFKKYNSFVLYLTDENISAIFRSITYEKRGKINISINNTYIQTFEIIKDKINNSKTYSNIIIYIEKINNPIPQIWDVVYDCLKNIDNSQYQWYNFDDLFLKNINDNSFLYFNSLILYIEKFSPSNKEMIFEILEKLEDENRIESIMKMCSTLIKRKIFWEDATKFMNRIKFKSSI